MEPVRELLRSRETGDSADPVVLTLYREDFSALYPGMIRYSLFVMSEKKVRAVFRTNTFEYSPLVPLQAESVAVQTADDWEAQLGNNPALFFQDHWPESPRDRSVPSPDLVVIQGSPRGDGNCSILAGWAVEAAHALGKTVKVIYPHDLDIHCCIGCYQCYNTGSCVFDDDMGAIIDAIRNTSLLVVCSPVYTNTVPGGLKLVIDRCQAFHAERVIYGGKQGQKGLLFSVAGRKGEENFTCIIRVISAFLRNLDIERSGDILIDHVDAIRDIRLIPGMESGVKEKIAGLLKIPLIKAGQPV
ncbi:MAG: flavodoxin family protein [Methanoregula sp.]|nr:flavodoxin family protein [Methanoregula sp.]